MPAKKRPVQPTSAQRDRHLLTQEERRRGGIVSGARRRELGQSFRERLAEKLDEQADDLIDQLLTAGGDEWRAIVAAIHEAFGKPVQELRHTTPDGKPFPLRIDPASLSDKEIEQLKTLLRKARTSA